MKLYLLCTVGLGDYWIVAEDSAKAETRLAQLLRKAEYGFDKDRRVKNIIPLTSELEMSGSGKPFFSGGDHRLILPDSCQIPLPENNVIEGLDE